MVITCNTISEIEETAFKIIDFAKDTRVWLFIGEMGSGKTTLIKKICQHFSVTEATNSPTFSIVNEYSNKKGALFYHIDLYRLDSEESAINIGIEDYLFSNQHCFIEWPGVIKNLLPDKYITVKISAEKNDARKITIDKHENTTP